MCLFILLLLLGPRAVIIVWWLLAPGLWSAAFATLLIPLLGFIFLPWTTLMFVIVAPTGFVGLVGLDYLWLGLALLVDVAGYTGGGAYGRRRARA